MNVPTVPSPVASVLAPVGVPQDTILLVEDSEDDVFHFQRMVRQSGVKVQLDVVTDGDMAVKWLSGRMQDAEAGRAPLPRAVFLDLKLPGMAGLDILRWLRSQVVLDPVMVVVCSWSSDVRDIAEAERLRADLYLTKYPPADQFSALLRVRDRDSIRR